MVGSSILPVVVRDLVIVPDADHRVSLMQSLQRAIAPVLRMPSPVVGARDGFVPRIGCPPKHRVIVKLSAELVDVVTDVQDKIDVITRCDLIVGVEVTHRVAATAHHRDAQSLGGPAGQSASSTDLRANLAARWVAELVEVHLAGFKRLGIEVHGKVSLGRGVHTSAQDHF